MDRVFFNQRHLPHSRSKKTIPQKNPCGLGINPTSTSVITPKSTFRSNKKIDSTHTWGRIITGRVLPFRHAIVGQLQFKGILRTFQEKAIFFIGNEFSTTQFQNVPRRKNNLYSSYPLSGSAIFEGTNPRFLCGGLFFKP